jgi:hypothetical protein
MVESSRSVGKLQVMLAPKTDEGAFGVSIEGMSIAEYDAMYVLLHSTPDLLRRLCC